VGDVSGGISPGSSVFGTDAEAAVTQRCVAASQT
jgi:hypothetical protein